MLPSFNRYNIGVERRLVMWIEYIEDPTVGSFKIRMSAKKVAEVIFKRDNYACNECGSKVNLVLHHRVYKLLDPGIKKMLPQETPTYYLSDFGTLCRACNVKSKNKRLPKIPDK